MWVHYNLPICDYTVTFYLIVNIRLFVNTPTVNICLIVNTPIVNLCLIVNTPTVNLRLSVGNEEQCTIAQKLNASTLLLR